MDKERIESFIKSSLRNNTTIDIRFKGRSTVTGLFIQANDFDELKSKNFWRIVSQPNIQHWSETNDVNLARIFNGASFASLADTKHTAMAEVCEQREEVKEKRGGARRKG